MQQEPSTAAAVTERPARRTWLPRVLAVAILVGAALALVRVGVLGGADEPTPAQRTATISADLKQRMTTTLEQLPPSGHQGHGGAAAGTATMVCGVRVYGYEPAGAASVAEVDTVYGFHMCAVAEPKMTWHWASKLVAPLSMRIDQQPPVIRMAESSATTTYQESLRQIIPPRYQQLAVEGALEPDTMADLQRRFETAAAG